MRLSTQSYPCVVSAETLKIGEQISICNALIIITNGSAMWSTNQLHISKLWSLISPLHVKSWLMYSQALINSIASFQSVLFLLCSFHMHWWFCARLQSNLVLYRIQRKVFGFVFFSIAFQDCQFYQLIPHSHFFIVASIAEYFLSMVFVNHFLQEIGVHFRPGFSRPSVLLLK